MSYQNTENYKSLDQCWSHHSLCENKKCYEFISSVEYNKSNFHKYICHLDYISRRFYMNAQRILLVVKDNMIEFHLQ